MDLADLEHHLADAAGGAVAGLATEITRAAATTIESTARGLKHAKSVVMHAPDGNTVSVGGTQPRGVYQEGLNPGVAIANFGTSVQSMAAQLAAAATGLITGGQS